MFFLAPAGLAIAQDLIPYLDHGKYGYANPAGQVVIEPRYDEVEFFDRFGVAAVRLDTQWWLINKQGLELVDLPSKSRQLSRVLSARSRETFGNDIHIDTMHGLVRQFIRSHSRRFINLHTGKVSPEFVTPRMMREMKGMLTGREDILHYGIYIGQTIDEQFHVMNGEAEIIASSTWLPTILNDSLVAYAIGDTSVILNFQDNLSYTLPFPHISDVINGEVFIFSLLQQTDPWRIKSPSLSLQKGLATRNGSIIKNMIYDDLAIYSDDRLLAKKDGRYFITDLALNRIDSITYHFVFDLRDGFYQAQLVNAKWVFLDATGRLAGNHQYDKIEYIQSREYYKVHHGDSVSILTKEHKPEITYRAEQIYKTEKPGYFGFEVDGKSGLLDDHGNMLIPAIYDQCHPALHGDFVIIGENNLQGLMSMSGQLLLEPGFEEIEIARSKNQTYVMLKKDGKYAYYDSALRPLSDFQPRRTNLYDIPIHWDRIEGDSFQFFSRFGQPLGFTVKFFSDGYAQPDSAYLLCITKGDTAFLMYEQQEQVVIDTFFHCAEKWFDAESGLLGVKVNEEEGVWHYTGRWVIPPSRQQVLYISPFLIVVKKGEHYMFYNAAGRQVNKVHCSDLEIELYHGAWRCTRDDKIGFISSHNGKVIVPPEYDEGFLHWPNCIVVNQSLSKRQPLSIAFDTLGNILAKGAYESIYPVDHQDVHPFFEVIKGGKAGMIDRQGKMIIPMDYRRVWSKADTTFFVARREDKSRDIFNRNSEIIFSGPTVPTGHEFIELPGHRYIFFYDDHSIVVDHLGKVIKRIDTDKIERDYLDDTEKYLLKAEKNGMYYFIHPETLVEYRGT